MNSDGAAPAQSAWGVESGKPIAPSPRALARAYGVIVSGRCATRAEPPAGSLLTSMSDEQQARYAKAIAATANSSLTTTLTPEILFSAADAAIADAASPVRLRVGLQPGTLDPIHYGHIAAALGALLADDLDLVALAVGGEVPDKPHVSDFYHRFRMASLAVAADPAHRLLRVTDIRQRTATMFASRPDLRALTGQTPALRRRNADLAAFIWLFRAHPGVAWSYIVGSDKVAAYGSKDERHLVETVTQPPANGKFLYFPRTNAEIRVAADIEPYHWLSQLWSGGSFARSSLPSTALGGSHIRAALAQGLDRVDGFRFGDCLPATVLDYMRRHSLATPASSAAPGRDDSPLV